MKIFSIFLFVFGVLFTFYGAYQYINTQHQQSESLSSAREIIGGKGDSSKRERPTNDAEPIAFNPQMGEVIGTLYIPAIDAEIAIIEGTSEDDLEKGVGHYLGTSFPLQGDQIVLSGHRDTVFRRMGELKVGDEFIVNMPYGSFSYKMVSTQIVDANDRTVIKPTAPNEILTITTCYPFSYIGNAPNRYIIMAVPSYID